MLPPRAGHTTVAFGKNLFVFGGFTDAQNLYDDLHMLDAGMNYKMIFNVSVDIPLLADFVPCRAKVNVVMKESWFYGNLRCLVGGQHLMALRYNPHCKLVIL